MLANGILANEVKELGLMLLGFDEQWQGRTCMATNSDRFKSGYGVDSAALAALFNDLLTRTDKVLLVQDKEVRLERPNLEDFLKCLNWFKSYDDEHTLAGRFKKDEKTIRNSNRLYVAAIQSLKEEKVHPC